MNTRITTTFLAITFAFLGTACDTLTVDRITDRPTTRAHHPGHQPDPGGQVTNTPPGGDSWCNDKAGTCSF